MPDLGKASPPSAPTPSSFRDLRRYRIWDCYGSLPTNARSSDSLEAAFEAMLTDVSHFGIERISPLLRVPLGAEEKDPDPARSREMRRCLMRWSDRLIGIATLNANDVRGSLDAMDRWIKDGPMAGVFFPSSDPAGLTCTHANFHPLVQRAYELGAVILQHTWFQTGGKTNRGESTPSELAELARRHPEINFVCVHAGGEWERGIRAIQNSPNILIETSGFDPTAGFLEMAVRDIGASRVIYGGHYPGRSFGTELSKVLGANLTEADRFLMFGENFRRLLKPLFAKKGWSLDKKG